jgi:hypothetical protein
MEQAQFVGAELVAHLVDLLVADAVLAGDGAAERHRQLEDLGAEGLGALQLAGTLASNRISGCRLPSPAWKTLMQRRPYFFSMAWIAVSISPRRLRGMVPSMQ